MSLGLALNTARTGIQAVQSALQVTANNIANANTEGFTRKTVAPISLLVAGQGAGVTLSTISRQVNQSLIRDMRAQLAGIGALRIDDAFYTRMQDLFGSLASGTSLTASIADLASAFEALAAFPEDNSLRQQVVGEALALTRQFNNTARDIQVMRTDADQGITDSIAVINIQLKQIAELNAQISRDLASGQPIANLEDKRDTAITKLAEFVNIGTFTKSSGEIVVVLKTGRVLLDGGAPTLVHTPAAALDVSVTYPGGIAAISLNGVDITSELTGAGIGAQIKMRDTTLPNQAAELNTLAGGIFTEINKIHNDGAAFPPPNTLTGTRTVASGDAFTATGTTHIAVTDAAGDLVATPIQLNLAAYATVGDFVTALNTALGANGTASIVGGKLVIDAAAAANGIAMNENDTSVGGLGVSHYFGLNDFFTGDATTSLSRNITVRSDLAANPDLMSRGELNPAAALVGDSGVTSGDNKVIQRLASQFGTAVSFNASGNLAATTTNFGDYAAQMLSVNATQAAAAADSLGFNEILFDDIRFRVDSASGVSIDEEMANLITLQNSYAAIARVMSVASEMMEMLNQMVR